MFWNNIHILCRTKRKDVFFKYFMNNSRSFFHFSLEMLDKQEAPQIPDSYGISVAYAVLLDITRSIGGVIQRTPEMVYPFKIHTLLRTISYHISFTFSSIPLTIRLSLRKKNINPCVYN